MSDWTKIDMKPKAVRRMLRRACRARGIDARTTDLHFVVEMRYRTDGVATLAVVTLLELGGSSHGADRYFYGYGVGVRSVADEHNELAGAHAAVRGAMECAATAIAHRAANSRQRAELDAKLDAAELAGKLAASMKQVLAESDKERARR